MPEMSREFQEQATVVNKDAAPEQMTLTPAQSFGRYEIVRLIGQGGMGAVYLAHDPLLNRKIALKTPTFGSQQDSNVKRFLRESQVIARLQHPNVCPVYDFGIVGNTPFLCMPYITGLPLSRRLTPNIPANPTWSARLVRQIASAMHYVHKEGVIHRDLKPANIMLNDGDEPVIMDFGLARNLNLSSLQLTTQGDIMGTPAYMSPEQVNGITEDIGTASDIYSLGVILFVMLTGRTPFLGDSLTMMMQIASDTPPTPSGIVPGLDKNLDDICLKAMEKSPKHRWESMQALAQALEAMLVVPTVPLRQPRRLLSTARLTLRIAGTHWAYRPPPSMEVITVGRQKRKPNDPVNQGNDLVLRVQGNDALSARISRHHFEIHQDGQGNYSLVDVSKTGVLINDRPAKKGVAEPLRHGDMLHVAGVVKVEVHLDDPQEWQALRPGAVVQAPSPDESTNHQLMMEASLGELGTIEGANS